MGFQIENVHPKWSVVLTLRWNLQFHYHFESKKKELFIKMVVHQMVNQVKVDEKVVKFDLQPLFVPIFLQIVFPSLDQVNEGLMEIFQGVNLEFYKTF